MTHVLHIANDYSGSKVYRQLVASLDGLGVTQTVFTTVRTPSALGRNVVTLQQSGSSIHYSDNWRPYHKLLFHEKVRSNYQALCSRIDLTTVDCVHAHTLFSDGALALKIKQQYGIPYVVAVRNTDVNTFMRFMVHTWPVGLEVLREAESVVFISLAYRRRVDQWVAARKGVFEYKSFSIANGVDSFWMERMESATHMRVEGAPWKLVSVSNYAPGKNLPRLMRAVVQLNRLSIPATLDIVGGGGADSKKIKRLAGAYPDFFTLHGRIEDKERLLRLMRNSHIFTLPSLRETFGLVYIEALTQGLPILYTSGEGVDGYFDVHYGRGCRPRSVKDIVRALRKIMNDYASVSIDEGYLRSQFSWQEIAQKYITVYVETICQGGG